MLQAQAWLSATQQDSLISHIEITDWIILLFCIIKYPRKKVTQTIFQKEGGETYPSAKKFTGYTDQQLSFNVPCISESQTEIKIKLNFYFHTSLWFPVSLWCKAFIKHFEAPRRSVKIKI